MRNEEGTENYRCKSLKYYIKKIELAIYKKEHDKDVYSNPAYLTCMQRQSVSQICHSVMTDSLDPMDGNTPGFPVHCQLPGLTQTHIHWVSDTIQQSHPLSSPATPVFNLSQHPALFKWVSSSYQFGEGHGNPLQYSLSWKILWREEPGGLQSMGSQRVRHDWMTKLSLSYQVAKVLELQPHH